MCAVPESVCRRGQKQAVRVVRIYLAAMYSRRAEMERYAESLRRYGLTVDARWFTGQHESSESQEQEMTLGQRRVAAVEDIEDLTAADALVAFTEPPNVQGDGLTRGGRHVEFGMALALGKPVVVVGPRENVFHTLPQVRQFDDWTDDVPEFLHWELLHSGPSCNCEAG